MKVMLVSLNKSGCDIHRIIGPVDAYPLELFLHICKEPITAY